MGEEERWGQAGWSDLSGGNWREEDKSQSGAAIGGTRRRSDHELEQELRVEGAGAES